MSAGHTGGRGPDFSISLFGSRPRKLAGLITCRLSRGAGTLVTAQVGRSRRRAATICVCRAATINKRRPHCLTQNAPLAQVVASSEMIPTGLP